MPEGFLLLAEKILKVTEKKGFAPEGSVWLTPLFLKISRGVKLGPDHH
jgi:hypothetical protein